MERRLINKDRILIVNSKIESNFYQQSLSKSITKIRESS